jgi:hypothetical protein
MTHALYTVHHAYAIDHTPYTVHHAPYTMHHALTSDVVQEQFEVSIIQRGSYIAPNRSTQPGEERLHLLIEGTNSQQVRSTVVIYTYGALSF